MRPSGWVSEIPAIQHIGERSGGGSETKIFREESLRLARDPFKAYKQSKASQRLFLRPGVSRR